MHTFIKARLISVVVHQNLTVCSLAHCQPSLKISCKSVLKFLHKVDNRQTDKQTNKRRRLAEATKLLMIGNSSITVPSLVGLGLTDAYIYWHSRGLKGGDIWRRYCCLTSFFSDCRYVPCLRRYSPTKLYDDAQMAIFIAALCNRAGHIYFHPVVCYGRPMK